MPSVLDAVYLVLKKDKGEFYSIVELSEETKHKPRAVSMSLNTLFQRGYIRESKEGLEWTLFKKNPIMRAKCACDRSWLYSAPKEQK